MRQKECEPHPVLCQKMHSSIIKSPHPLCLQQKCIWDAQISWRMITQFCDVNKTLFRCTELSLKPCKIQRAFQRVFYLSLEFVALFLSLITKTSHFFEKAHSMQCRKKSQQCHSIIQSTPNWACNVRQNPNEHNPLSHLKIQVLYTLPLYSFPI